MEVPDRRALARCPGAVRQVEQYLTSASIGGPPTAPGSGCWPRCSPTPMRWASWTGSPRSTPPSLGCISTVPPFRGSRGAVSNYRDPRLREPADHAIGRSRGGLTSKIHLVADGRGRPLNLILTPANINDTTMLVEVIGGIRVARPGPGRPRGRRPAVVLADKGYPSRGQPGLPGHPADQGEHPRPRRPARRPANAGACSRRPAARLRCRPLPSPQRRRNSILQPAQELARHRHPHRQDRPQLPSRHPARRDLDLDQDRLNQHALGVVGAKVARPAMLGGHQRPGDRVRSGRSPSPSPQPASPSRRRAGAGQSLGSTVPVFAIRCLWTGTALRAPPPSSPRTSGSPHVDRVSCGRACGFSRPHISATETRETLMTRTTVHRPTSSINHHRILSAAATAGLVGTLLAVTLGSASAMPGRGDPPPAPVPVRRPDAARTRPLRRARLLHHTPHDEPSPAPRAAGLLHLRPLTRHGGLERIPATTRDGGSRADDPRRTPAEASQPGSRPRPRRPPS